MDQEAGALCQASIAMANNPQDIRLWTYILVCRGCGLQRLARVICIRLLPNHLAAVQSAAVISHRVPRIYPALSPLHPPRGRCCCHWQLRRKKKTQIFDHSNSCFGGERRHRHRRIESSWMNFKGCAA